jgi:hypothetical protein
MELCSYYFFTLQMIKDVWINKHTEIKKKQIKQKHCHNYGNAKESKNWHEKSVLWDVSLFC